MVHKPQVFVYYIGTDIYDEPAQSAGSPRMQMLWTIMSEDSQ